MAQKGSFFVLAVFFWEVYVNTVACEEVRFLKTVWVLDVKDFALGFWVSVAVLVDSFEGVIVESTEEKDFVVTILDAAGVKLWVREAKAEDLPGVLTFWKSFNSVNRQERVASCFLNTSKAVKSTSVIEETETWRELWLFQFW